MSDLMIYYRNNNLVFNVNNRELGLGVSKSVAADILAALANASMYAETMTCEIHGAEVKFSVDDSADKIDIICRYDDGYIAGVSVDYYKNKMSMELSANQLKKDLLREAERDSSGSILKIGYARELTFMHWVEEERKLYDDIVLKLTPEQAAPFLREVLVCLYEHTSKIGVGVGGYLATVDATGNGLRLAFRINANSHDKIGEFYYTSYSGGLSLADGIRNAEESTRAWIR